MIITHKLKPMDLAQKQNTGKVDVVQGDKYSRNIEFTFMYNGSAWQIPDGTTAIVRYKKPDATGGNYDTLPDGSTAYQINGNVLTVALAPQVCTVPGQVQLSVGLINGNAEINTFSVNIIVQPNPGAEYQSEDYIRLSGYVPNSGWSPNMYLGTDASGNVVAKEGAGAVPGGTGGAALPIARGESNDGIAYTATGDDLPVVLASSAEQYGVGKGRQIVFIPYAKNANTAPTLQLNGGSVIPIRQRAPQNQGSNDISPDATLPVPAGSLMRGVPYTLTFCGKYWLVDSQIATVPAPTATDAGKVLTVSDAGAAVWTDIAAGADGKSAYDYAVEGGYTGTETEFAEKLAQEQLTGTTDSLTPTQVYDAVSAGIPVKVQYTDPTFGLSSFTAFNVSETMNVIASNAIVNYQNAYLLAALYGNKSNNGWYYEVTPLAKPSDIPSALPNPNAITFTGAVTGSYDGSNAKTVNIPSAVTDDHINSLIDTKLGVIENGSY